MKTAEQFYNEMKHLPVEEHAAYLQTLLEEERMKFFESFMDSLEKLREESKQLSKDVEEALLEKAIKEVYEQAVDTLETEENVEIWMNAYNAYLDAVPAEMLTTVEGSRAVIP